ncbi:MAG TPA: radical SAM family heme chaperone HemW [Candidatus Competibacteraceae bacterium]|nr:radical SAM family heme chaperone HemW [Candidatus Competibacteraceae bacterium]
MINFAAHIPLTLYIHLPWCVHKCPYCDFNSHALRSELPERAYVDALFRDLEQDLPRIENRRVESIFIGGGTPSLFSAEAIDRLLCGLRARLHLAEALEITLEANPGAMEQDKFRGFREAGVNRLSLGVQSFNAEHLQRLGRIHGRQEAIRAAEAAHAAGFDNFNLDLMFGLPGQSLEQSLADVDAAIALEPAHISHYQLTLEPGTGFYKQPPAGLPDDDLLWDMQEHCQQRLAENGYTHYEVSAYARPGKRCFHNLNYWEFGDYLGIGAGAHGKLSNSQGRIYRLWKRKNPRDYLKYADVPDNIGGIEPISAAERILEFMLNALRLVEGFPAGLFSERTGLPLQRLLPLLNQAKERELLEWNAHFIRPTELGRRFLNDLLELFLPEAHYACDSIKGQSTLETRTS